MGSSQSKPEPAHSSLAEKLEAKKAQAGRPPRHDDTSSISSHGLEWSIPSSDLHPIPTPPSREVGAKEGRRLFRRNMHRAPSPIEDNAAEASEDMEPQYGFQSQYPPKKHVECGSNEEKTLPEIPRGTLPSERSSKVVSGTSRQAVPSSASTTRSIGQQTANSSQTGERTEAHFSPYRSTVESQESRAGQTVPALAHRFLLQYEIFERHGDRIYNTAPVDPFETSVTLPKPPPFPNSDNEPDIGMYQTACIPAAPFPFPLFWQVNGYREGDDCVYLDDKGPIDPQELFYAIVWEHAEGLATTVNVIERVRRLAEDRILGPSWTDDNGSSLRYLQDWRYVCTLHWLRLYYASAYRAFRTRQDAGVLLPEVTVPLPFQECFVEGPEGSNYIEHKFPGQERGWRSIPMWHPLSVKLGSRLNSRSKLYDDIRLAAPAADHGAGANERPFVFPAGISVDPPTSGPSASHRPPHVPVEEEPLSPRYTRAADPERGQASEARPEGYGSGTQNPPYGMGFYPPGNFSMPPYGYMPSFFAGDRMPYPPGPSRHHPPGPSRHHPPGPSRPHTAFPSMPYPACPSMPYPACPSMPYEAGPPPVPHPGVPVYQYGEHQSHPGLNMGVPDRAYVSTMPRAPVARLRSEAHISPVLTELEPDEITDRPEAQSGTRLNGEHWPFEEQSIPPRTPKASAPLAKTAINAEDAGLLPSASIEPTSHADSGVLLRDEVTSPVPLPSISPSTTTAPLPMPKETAGRHEIVPPTATSTEGSLPMPVTAASTTGPGYSHTQLYNDIQADVTRSYGLVPATATSTEGSLPMPITALSTPGPLSTGTHLANGEASPQVEQTPVSLAIISAITLSRQPQVAPFLGDLADILKLLENCSSRAQLRIGDKFGRHLAKFAKWCDSLEAKLNNGHAHSPWSDEELSIVKNFLSKLARECKAALWDDTATGDKPPHSGTGIYNGIERAEAQLAEVIVSLNDAAKVFDQAYDGYQRAAGLVACASDTLGSIRFIRRAQEAFDGDFDSGDLI